MHFCNILDGAFVILVNGFQSLTNATKNSELRLKCYGEFRFASDKRIAKKENKFRVLELTIDNNQ